MSRKARLAGRNQAVATRAMTKASSPVIPQRINPIELAFENHRWYDLLRFGKAVETMNNQFDKQGFNITIDTHNLIFPIPQREIDLGLIQNPGY